MVGGKNGNGMTTATLTDQRCAQCVNVLADTDTGPLCARCITDSSSRDTSSAWVRLCRLCGCNYRGKVVKRTAKFVYVQHPQQREKTYRIPAAEFDAGENAHRDGWVISAWNDKAARTCRAEENWQT